MVVAAALILTTDATTVTRAVAAVRVPAATIRQGCVGMEPTYIAIPTMGALTVLARSVPAATIRQGGVGMEPTYIVIPTMGALTVLARSVIRANAITITTVEAVIQAVTGGVNRNSTRKTLAVCGPMAIPFILLVGCAIVSPETGGIIG